MLVTESGMLMLVRLMQLQNALSSILIAVSGMMMLYGVFMLWLISLDVTTLGSFS